MALCLHRNIMAWRKEKSSQSHKQGFPLFAGNVVAVTGRSTKDHELKKKLSLAQQRRWASHKLDICSAKILSLEWSSKISSAAGPVKTTNLAICSVNFVTDTPCTAGPVKITNLRAALPTTRHGRSATRNVSGIESYLEAEVSQKREKTKQQAEVDEWNITQRGGKQERVLTCWMLGLCCGCLFGLLFVCARENLCILTVSLFLRILSSWPTMSVFARQCRKKSHEEDALRQAIRPLVVNPDCHFLAVLTVLVQFILERRTDCPISGVFGAEKTRAAAGMIAGLLVIDSTLKVMVVTKENAATLC